MMMFQAMEETESTNPEKIKDYLNNMETFVGASGSLIADGEGAFTKNYVIYEVQNGKPVLIE